MDDTTTLVRPPAPTPPGPEAMPLPTDITVGDAYVADLAMVNWLHDEDSLDAYRDAQAERRRRTLPIVLSNAAKIRVSDFEAAYARAIEDGDAEGVLSAALGRAAALAEVEALKWTPYHLRGTGPAAARLKAHQDSRAELRSYFAVAAIEANVVPAALMKPFNREASLVASQIDRAQAALRALENDLDPRREKAANSAIEKPTALLAQARELVNNPLPAQKPYQPRKKAS